MFFPITGKNEGLLLKQDGELVAKFKMMIVLLQKLFLKRKRNTI